MNDETYNLLVNKISLPTPEKFIQLYLGVNDEFMESMKEQMSKFRGFDFDNITDLMNEYATLKSKYHVEKALKKASQNYAQGSLTPGKGVSIENAILNAYPLTNIK
mgnify:CR=1 FL=1